MLEAKVLELLFHQADAAAGGPKEVEELNVNPGAFGRGPHTYAHANGEIGRGLYLPYESRASVPRPHPRHPPTGVLCVRHDVVAARDELLSAGTHCRTHAEQAATGLRLAGPAAKGGVPLQQ